MTVSNWSIAYDKSEINKKLHTLENPCYLVKNMQTGRVGITNDELPPSEMQTQDLKYTGMIPAMPAHTLGSAAFREAHGTKYAYMVGSMARGISSAEMVIALGKANFLGSFGAGGLGLKKVEEAIQRIQKTLPNGPYAFNLIHNPQESAIEEGTIDLFLKHNIHTIEASAYLRLTPAVVRYRVAGLTLDSGGKIIARNKIIAKLSRPEVARRFMKPASAKLLKKLVTQRKITEQQAKLAEKVPLANDVTLEADSGGHTDNQSLVCLMPTMIALRDKIQAEYQYPSKIRIGAAGGIGTPTSALAAFIMGADYIVTGSVNQSCVEAGTSEQVKALLAKARISDMRMAPAADMFEIGAEVQVLKRGTLFATQAKKLENYYRTYEAIEDIPAEERTQIEEQIFQRGIDEVWQACLTFFGERDPEQIARARQDPKRKMALIFRWYLGLAAHWAIRGNPDRTMDYQIWCGPAMGAFNVWVRGTPLEDPKNRLVVDVAQRLMTGAAYQYRVQMLKMWGVEK